MTDLVKRLRGEIPHRVIESHWTVDFDALDAERAEAADEIERLQDLLALTRAMLPTGYRYEVVRMGKR